MTNDPATLILYRPVGQAELNLIAASAYRRFPPRLPEQPIFYPVLSEAYATYIAERWNTRYNADRIGYVTRFRVDATYASRFPVQTVGSREHQELWVPAEDLDEFNSHIVGAIEVISRYQGPSGAA